MNRMRMPTDAEARKALARRHADSVFDHIMKCSHIGYEMVRPGVEVRTGFVDGLRHFKPCPQVSLNYELIMPEESEGEG